MTTTMTEVQSVKELIAGACARRLPAELCHVASDEMIIMGRVRLLDCTDSEILADRPQYLDDDGTIPLKSPITMHVAIGRARYQFDTAIVKENRALPAGNHHALPGIALRMPTTVNDSQRRRHVRASLTGYDPISVDFSRTDPEGEAACSVNLERGSGWLVDLSVGSVSLIADDRLFIDPQRGNRYFLTFRLPDVKDEFYMIGCVRRMREAQNGDGVRLALYFCPWDGNRLARDQHRLARFIADHERRMLRRGR